MNRQKDLKSSSINMNYPAPYSPSWLNETNKKTKEKVVTIKNNATSRQMNQSWPTNARPEKRRKQKQPTRQITQSWPTEMRSERKRKQNKAAPPSPAAGCCWMPRPRVAPTQSLKYGIFRKGRVRSPLPLLYDRQFERGPTGRVVRVEVEKEKPKPKTKALTPQLLLSRLRVTEPVHLDIKPIVGRYISSHQ